MSETPRKRSRRWRIWPRRSELTRRVDRIETAVLAAVLIVATLLVPVALAVGSETYADQVRLGEDQSRLRHRVSATLLQDAPESSGGAHGEPLSAVSNVQARWIAPDGTRHTGTIKATAGAAAGSTAPVWLNDAGESMSEPVTREQAALSGIAMAMGLYLAAAAALCTIFLVTRAALNRSRAAAWQREWARIGPEWSRSA